MIKKLLYTLKRFCQNLLITFKVDKSKLQTFVILIFVVTTNMLQAETIGPADAVATKAVFFDPPCNTDDPVAITSTNYGSLVATGDTDAPFLGCTTVLGCGLSGESNMIDANLSNYALVKFGTSVDVTHTLKVENQAAGEFFQSGSFAGFLIQNSGIQVDLFGAITVKTYLDGNPRETSTSSNLVGLGVGGNQYYAGFYTTQTYDAIEISFSSALSIVGLSETRVYYAVTNRYCENTTTLACNTQTSLAKPTFPARIVPERTIIDGALTLGSIANANNVVDSNANNYATINLVADVAASASLSVKDQYTNYQTGTFAGFDIENPRLIGANLLSGITIKTYLEGVEQQSSADIGVDLLSVNSGLLSGSGRQTVGFVATAAFDEIKLEIDNVLGLLSTTYVYNAILESFCAGPALACNTPTDLIKGAGNFPVIIDGANTGIDGVCVLCSVSDTDNVINSNVSDFATITMNGSIGATGELAVKDVLTSGYAAGTFAGFKVSSEGLLAGVTIGAAVTIKTYKDGIATGDSEIVVSSLLGIDPSLIDGNGNAVLGFVTTVPFDEIKIEYNALVSALFTAKVYGAVIEKYCPGPALECNTPTPFAKPTFSAVIEEARTGFSGTLAVGSIVGANNVVDSDNANYASINLILGVSATASLSVKDQNTDYPVGTFAGFDIESPSLVGIGLLSGITVKTYLNGVAQESSANPGVNLLSVNSGLTGTGRQTVGFVATVPFDEITLEIENVVGALGTTRVYNAVLEKFCAGPALACNTQTELIGGDGNFPVIIDGVNTGIDGVCVGCSVSDTQYVINNNPVDHATIVMAVGLGIIGQIAVQDVLTAGYAAGTFAGFDIENPNLVGVNLLSGITVKTYLDGVEQETSTDIGIELLSVDAGLLSGSGRQTIGFVTTTIFDEVKLEIENTLGILSTTNVYSAVVKNFCAGPDITDPAYCNTQLTLAGDDFPVIINGSNTGTNDGGLLGLPCVGCSVNNSENVINNDVSDFATIIMAASIDNIGQIAVHDVLATYAAGTFAGFDIENPSLVGVNLLSGITIKTYLNGVLAESMTGGNLLSVNSGLLAGSGRQTVGFVSTSPFDEVKLEIQNVLGLLSTTNVYNAIIENFCEGPELACNTSTAMVSPAYPVIIDNANTGVDGILCALCSVSDTNNLINADTDDYAEIVLTAAVGASGSIAVKDVLTDYVGGTFAGFDITHASLLNVDLLNLLNNITIITYKDGVLVESATGASGPISLIAANTSLLNAPDERRTVGFITTLAFDEVKISIANIANVDLGTIKVYNAVFENFCKVTLDCDENYFLSSSSDPTKDFPVIIDNKLTGIGSLACVGCDVTDAENVISEDLTDFANIQIPIGVAGSGTIAVQNVVGDFPAGSTIGFVIKDNNNLLVQLELFSSLTICTYLDGVVQECKSAGNLLDLSLLNIIHLGITNPIDVGFTTTLPFDEISISVGALVGVLSNVNVYSAFVETTNAYGDVDGDTWVCCPTITNNSADNVKPTICGGSSDGSIKICGLNANSTGHTINYDLNGTPATPITNQTADSDGCIVVSNLTSGTYTNIKVSNLSCPAGSDAITIILNYSAETDTDLDGIPDRCDLDNDNDGILDSDEGFCSIPATYNWASTPIETVSPTTTNPHTFGTTTFNTSIVTQSTIGDDTYTTSVTSGSFTGWRLWHDVQPAGVPVVATIDFVKDVNRLAFQIGGLDEGTTGSGKKEQLTIDIILANGSTYILKPADFTIPVGYTYLENNVFQSGNSGTPPDAAVTMSISTQIYDIDKVNFSYTFNDDSVNGGYVMIGNLSGCMHLDTDKDDIPDYLDTDSDNDGCADAIEGAGNFTAPNLTSSNNLADADEGVVNDNGIPVPPGTAGNGTTGQATTAAVIANDIISTVVITSNPTPAEICEGEDITFTAAPTGTRVTVFNQSPTADTTIPLVAGDFIYKWYKDSAPGTILSTIATLTVSSASAADAGGYTVEVTTVNNGCPKEETVTLTVNALPTIVVSSAVACSIDYSTYSVSVTVSTGAVTVTPAVGTITNIGNVWTIVGIPTGTDIILKVEDGNMCSASLEVVSPVCAPDYKPTIFPGNTNVIGSSGVVDFRVLIGEYLDVNSNGITDVELRIFKNTAFSLSFDSNITIFNGSNVNNQEWVYDGSHPAFHKFTYVGNGGIFQKNSAQFIGISATYSPLIGSSGDFPIKTTVRYLSGGEIRVNNNNDIDYITYKNN